MSALGAAVSEGRAREADWTRDGFMARAWIALDMALQPIALMRSGTIYGYEALMRGHEALGLASIAEVLDTAHRLGLAKALHLLLLDKALRKLTAIDGPADKKLFFNLDGRVLDGNSVDDGEALHEETAALLRKYGLDPSSLCIELSETFDYAGAKDVADMVAGHREHGIRFALDDFGRGFSELKVLYEYHPEFIKIDRFFVSGMVSDSRKRLFVSTLVNLAHVLGIRVVIEGVETEQEYEQGWRLGCDLVQGYFVARPMREFPDGHATCPHLNLSLRRERERKEMRSAIIAERTETFDTIADTATIGDVMEAFRYARGQSLLPVLDSGGEPKGIVREADLKEFSYSPYGRDLLQNSSCRRDLSDFVTTCPIADITSSAESILDMFACQETTDGIIITDDSKYVGFLSALSLLDIINDKRLEDARDQNPLSKLPGNASITRYSDAAVNDAQADRTFCYIDFDNFKPFNDSYSFREGDRAIVIFADLLKLYFRDSRYEIGHVGGDDFFVGAMDVPDEELTTALANLRREFSSSVASLYSPEDRERGYIEADDRYGKRRKFPLLTCSIAIVKLPRGRTVETVDTLLYEMARMKSESKAAHDGIAMSDLKYSRPHKAGGFGPGDDRAHDGRTSHRPDPRDAIAV